MKIIIDTPKFLQAEFFMRDEEVTKSELPLVEPKQVHENRILIVDELTVNKYALPQCPEADGIFLRTRNAEASLRFADCVPVLLWNENSAMILHSGYKGTIYQIVPKGVLLYYDFGEKIRNLHAWIGPCIGRANYARNMYNDKWTSRGLSSFSYKNMDIDKANEKIYFDLAGEIKLKLYKIGLEEENITLSGIDTFEDPNCYSYRRGDKTERMTLKIRLLPSSLF